eukprot:GHVU01108642.1.p3 GENE.GHVU01108642.1~~GHVU01108642.1.p3  ORF type:complete len:104 (-),score=11.09 GHVU01108642.1:186-497(-)
MHLPLLPAWTLLLLLLLLLLSVLVHAGAPRLPVGPALAPIAVLLLSCTSLPPSLCPVPPALNPDAEVWAGRPVLPPRQLSGRRGGGERGGAQPILRGVCRRGD